MINQCHEKMSSIIPKKIGKQQLNRRLAIQSMVHLAAKPIAPVWPLKTFIACNALQGFESKPFDEALNDAQCLFEQDGIEYQDINRETIKWCGAYFDEGQRVIKIPVDEQGFYSAFKALAKYDKMLHRGLSENKKWLKQLPDHAEDVIVQCLDVLKIADGEQLSFLKKSLAQLPGWSGYMKWRTDWQNTSSPPDSQSNLVLDFIAVRLVITVLLNPNMNSSNRIFNNTKPDQHLIIEQIKKLEENYKNDLIWPLLNEAKTMHAIPQTLPDVQLVFCIDVLSEPFLLHL